MYKYCNITHKKLYSEQGYQVISNSLASVLQDTESQTEKQKRIRNLKSQAQVKYMDT